jgi:L-amino acid N-acyltransferase YncA
MPFPAVGVRTEPMTGAHATAVLAIYQAGIEEGNATFEARAPDWAAFTAARLPAHRYVATTAGRVAGWVAASAVSGRCVYAGVVEHSVYVHPAARGRGIGRLLLDTLIASTEAAGIWTIQSGIFPENAASLALHQAAGFRVVGTRERIGQHHGRWRDVVLIERLSPADGPVPDTARGNSQQSHDRGKYHAGHDPGRHGDRPGPRAAGQHRHRPVRPDHRPPCQRPASGPAGRVRAGELRRDQARSPNSATAACAAASGARPKPRCRR